MSQAQYGALADQIARKHGIDPGLFRRLISAESGWNAGAGSPAGARGLTQLMPGTARGLGVRNLNDPRQQLEGGATYLAKQLKTFKNPRLALAAYNAGPGAVSKYHGVPPYAETQSYVNKIMSGYHPGQASGAGAAGPPPAAALAPGETVAQVAPSIDAKRLMMLLNNQRGRSLRGIMPAAGFQRELQKVVSQALPRAQVSANVQQIGAQVARVGGQAAGAMAVAAGQEIVKQQVPYSWGGGTPSGPSFGFGRGAKTKGFDCSSFAQYIWAKEGVKLPRTTYGQIKAGHPVGSVAQARPGDLLFPHAGHVQVYIGNGQVIEEPRTGGHAQVAPVRSSYLAIRRPA